MAALTFTPPGEDPTKGTRAQPVSIASPGTPPGEDGLQVARELENESADYASDQGFGDDDDQEQGTDFLALLREAETSANSYADRNSRRAWSDSLRAFHNEHFLGSKYTRQEYRSRSKLFVPKTRGAVRKDSAAVAASLFNSIDAITCLPGNESDPRQRGSAAVMTELVNYRTDSTSGKAAFPWFLTSLGARQDAVLTGVCITKQYWKQEFRHGGTRTNLVTSEDGQQYEETVDVWEYDVNRPDMTLFPPENVTLDPAAEWTNPAQTSSFIVLKYPLTIDEIKKRQKAPINPWLELSEAQLIGSEVSETASTIRRAREKGIDRLEDAQNTDTFRIVWVYETFMRFDGEDWTFYSIGNKHYLTEPKLTREVYPEQYGERPLALGYGSLESHRISPMAPAESWQPLQNEANDLRNLRLDATKQNVMPISKVRRGRQVDIDQVRRRSYGSSILVQEPDDVTWETPPQIPATVVEMSREIDIEFDDLAGVQNYGNVQQNNALGKTLGGLKLAAGSANAVQEFDIRVWIETWATPALSQIVRLEQYYEDDKTVLMLCAERAQLLQKHGVSLIDDEFLQQEITIRVSVGLGAGDPQQRLAKFEAAAQVVGPLLAQTKEFQTGQVELDWEAVCTEVFGAAGYRDGGRRFFKINDAAPQNPMQDLAQQKLQSEIERNKASGKAALLTGLAAVAKVTLGKRALEESMVDSMLGRQLEAKRLGFEHGHKHNDQHLAALDHGHRHGLAIIGHKRQLAQDAQQQANADREFAARQAEAAQPDNEQV